jgi:hypothetical protein
MRSTIFLCLWVLVRRLQSIASTFHWTRSVNGIKPSLVKINEKDDIVSEATDSRHSRHTDNEGKQVVNESVQALVNENPPREMCH